MKRISESEYQQKIKEIEEDNLSAERRKNLKELKAIGKPKKKFPATSKVILFFTILICFEIVFFTEYIVIKFDDTNALYTLIGVPTTLIPTILGYFYKSKAENTEGGIVYQMALKDVENESDESITSG